MLVGDSRLMSLVEAQTLPLSMGFCSLFLMYIVGVGDDLVGVRYRAKFVAQILCAVFIIMGGFWINSFHGFLWIDSIPAWLGWPLTVLYIVFVCNALNLIDGIDGLASGLAMTGFIIYGVTFYLWDSMYMPCFRLLRSECLCRSSITTYSATLQSVRKYLWAMPALLL